MLGLTTAERVSVLLFAAAVLLTLELIVHQITRTGHVDGEPVPQLRPDPPAEDGVPPLWR